MEIDNILQTLLKKNFPDSDISGMMEVINATPNKLVAVELLCGIYKYPKSLSSLIDLKTPGKKFQESYRNRFNFKFESFDKFKGIIKYSYDSYRESSHWVEKSLPKDKKPKFISELTNSKHKASLFLNITLTELEEKYEMRNYIFESEIVKNKEDFISFYNWIE